MASLHKGLMPFPYIPMERSKQLRETNTYAHVSFNGSSNSRMQVQRPPSVRGFKYRKCDVFPDVASLHDSTQNIVLHLQTYVSKDVNSFTS
jgi:hypothetical protein